MNEAAAPLTGRLVSDTPLDREFEERLTEASTLAFRVAYGVLRQREDAEDVAQEAAVRAYRGFTSLRNRDQFRSWLVRIAWRLALDRRQRLLAGQMCFTIAFVAVVGNLLELGENNRFRFETDPLSVCLLGLTLQSALDRVRGRAPRP